MITFSKILFGLIVDCDDILIGQCSFTFNINNISERNTIIENMTFILGNPYGEENPVELLYYGFNQVQCQYVEICHQEQWCTNRDE